MHIIAQSKSAYQKMTKEVLLLFVTLPLYVMFIILWLFQYVIKTMWNIENIRSNDEFFADIVDTPKEVIEHHRKREYLKGAINKREVYLLGGKKQWTHERADKN